MIRFEWEIRGLCVIRREIEAGRLDKYLTVPPAEVPAEVRKLIAQKAVRDYAATVGREP